MNLIFHLNIPMMPRAGTKIWQCALPIIHKRHKLLALHNVVIISVHQLADLANDLVFLFLRHVLRRLVFHAVELEDFLVVPEAIIVEVVEGEERGGVKVADVMLLCFTKLVTI